MIWLKFWEFSDALTFKAKWKRATVGSSLAGEDMSCQEQFHTVRKVNWMVQVRCWKAGEEF